MDPAITLLPKKRKQQIHPTAVGFIVTHYWMDDSDSYFGNEHSENFIHYSKANYSTYSNSPLSWGIIS